MQERAHPAPTPQRLCFLAVGRESYGMRRAWGMLLAEFTARGWPITMVILQADTAESWQAELPPGVTLVLAPVHPGPSVQGRGPAKAAALMRRGTAQIRAARWLRGILRAGQIDRLVVRDPMAVGLAGLAAHGTGAQTFWILPNTVSDGYPLDLNRRLYRLLFTRFGVVPVANSRFTDSTLGPGGFRREVCHLGINPDIFDPARVDPEAVTSLRQRLGIDPAAPVLGLFARMTPEKGQAMMIEALATCDEAVHLVLCGGPLDTAFARDLRAHIDTLDLAGRVHFEGHQSDLGTYYALSDVVVNARLDPEPFGLSVIEGMAMARPVLAHRAGGPGETVRDGETGWLIDAPTKAAFADGLDRMFRDRNRWGEMGRQARAHVLKTYTSEKLVDRLIAIFGPLD